MKSAVVLALLVACMDRDHGEDREQTRLPLPAPTVTSDAAHAIAAPRPTTLTHVTIKALGMYCEESCPMRVRYALAEIKTVYELGFDLPHEAIFVSYDASLGAPKQVTRAMLAAIKQAGFDPWLAKESWPDDAQTQVVAR